MKPVSGSNGLLSTDLSFGAEQTKYETEEMSNIKQKGATLATLPAFGSDHLHTTTRVQTVMLAPQIVWTEASGTTPLKMPEQSKIQSRRST